jgi:hypothetical protein
MQIDIFRIYEKAHLISDLKKKISFAGARTHENDYFRAMQHLGSTRIQGQPLGIDTK